LRDCLNAEEILGLLGDEGLAPEVESEIHAHLAECEACAALLAASSRTSADVASTLASGQASAGLRLGRYEIEALIGCGAHGAVYRCLDPSLRRPVAVKVERIDPDQAPESAERLRARLLEEARSMARFRHANVVPIFDVGTFEGQVYLVMELMEGGTLRQWLRDHAAGWREVVDRFVLAGRGLAAAHAVGLVHRDFKPENVLIDEAGEVKVSDFGLALETATPAGALTPELPAVAVPASSSEPSSSESRSIAGTPGYMAPEQLGGRPSGPPADQFGFCAALYEALYGELPYPRQVSSPAGWIMAEPPSGTRVPRWVRRILLRGLALAPEDRYPTLDELLGALTADPSARRRRLLAKAGVVGLTLAALSAAGLTLFRIWAADPCRSPEGELAQVWNGEARARVRAAFAAAGGAGALATAAYAEKAMDRASGAWLAAYRDACVATRERHVQPEAALNLRLDCLAEQRMDMQAAVDILEHPRGDDLASTLGAAITLPAAGECADARLLPIVPPIPAAVRPQVDRLRLQLARGTALMGAGRYHDALEALKGVPKEAEALGLIGLEVKALDRLGTAHADLDDYRPSLELYRRAEALATAAQMHVLATAAAAGLAEAEALSGGTTADVDRWLGRAREDLQRVGMGGESEYDVDSVAGLLEALRGHPAEAAVDLQRALQLAHQILGRDRIQVLRIQNNLALALADLGRYDESLALQRNIVASLDGALGPRNPQALLPEINLARALFNLGRTDDAAAALQDLFARTSDRERAPEAEGLALRAAVEARQGDRAASLRSAALAVDMGSRLGLLSIPNWDDLHALLMEAYLDDGRADLAVQEYQKFIAPTHPPSEAPGDVRFWRLGGWAYLAAGQPRRALPLLESTLKVGAVRPQYPSWMPRAQYQLAAALVEVHGARSRAEALAEAAHEALSKKAEDRDLLSEVDEWRARTFAMRGHAMRRP